MKKSVLVISLLSSTFIMYPDITIASGIPTYTHTYTPELKPISFAQPDKAFKTAAVCFLGSGGCGSVGFGKADDNMNIDTGNQCKNDGYSITSCSLPTYPNGACPYNGAYFAKCVADKPRACKESGFSETLCPSGMVVDKTCTYDSSYMNCKAGNSCDGYYDCGGSWQYCTGTICSKDSSKCSVSCVSDYFPNSCSSSAACSAAGGVYRSGYCSKSCGSSGSSSSDDSSSSLSECENPGCHDLAYCNYMGNCFCNDGYYGNGTTYCDPDLCIGVNCGTNARCDNATGGCYCPTGTGGDPYSICREHYTSEWLCCDYVYGETSFSLGYDACMSRGSYGDPNAFVSQCEAQGGSRSSTVTHYATSGYEVCSYQCYFPD